MSRPTPLIQRIAAFIAGLVMLALMVAAQAAQTPAAAPATYQPTEVQSLRLENARLKAVLAQAQFRQAQQALTETVQALYATCGQVKLENKWPDGVGCDASGDRVTFRLTAQPTAAAPPVPTPATPEKK